MEKVWTLLWILFAIGAFVFRMVKKMQETSAQESRERPGGAVPSLPTASFQEMLRQMQARNVGETEPGAPVPKPAGPLTLAGRPMPRETARPARSQERIDVKPVSLEAPAVAQAGHMSAPIARRASGLPRASTAPSGSISRPPAPVPGAVGATVRRWLTQPESVRAAFVLSEVLRRKY